MVGKTFGRIPTISRLQSVSDRRLIWLLVLLSAGLAWSIGRVQAQELPPVEYYHNSPQMVGGEPPTLTITSYEPIENAVLTLRRGRERQRFELGDVRRGQSAQVTFESPLGVHQWRAEVEGMWCDEPFAMSFEFDYEISEGLEMTILLDQVDLDRRQLTLVMNRPANRVDYEIMRDDGVLIGEGSVDFQGDEPGTPLLLTWTQGEGTVLKITLTGHDVDGFWAQMELIPWSVYIPHEEVNFETGSAVIPDHEQHKIDHAYQQVIDAVERYGEFVDINLYVAGYTDTVGSQSDNQELSNQRARSIARAFRQRGFVASIYYQGFGETVLAVPTPDDTDQLANRRALYILAAQPPLPSAQIPLGHWRQVD